MPEDMRVAPHNVVAAYVERDAALAARERLLQDGVDEGSISIDARADALMVADAEMRQEADGLVGGPGLVATESQSKGAGAGFLIAGAIGAAIGLAIGAIVFDSTFGLIVCAIVGAVAGAIFGGTAGGFVRSRTKEKPRRSLQGYNVALGVHSDSADSVDRAEAILKATAPSRLERFNRGDTPHQVPLDPSG